MEFCETFKQRFWPFNTLFFDLRVEFRLVNVIRGVLFGSRDKFPVVITVLFTGCQGCLSAGPLGLILTGEGSVVGVGLPLASS